MELTVIKASRAKFFLMGMGLCSMGFCLKYFEILEPSDQVEEGLEYFMVAILMVMGVGGMMKGLFGRSRIELDEAGITVVNFRRRKFIAWEDCSKFEAYKFKNAQLIGCRLHKAARFMRATHGYDLVITLPGTNHVEVTNTINAYREKALESAMVGHHNITGLANPLVPELPDNLVVEETVNGNQPAVWRRAR